MFSLQEPPQNYHLHFYGAWPTPCSSVDCPGKTPGWGLRSTDLEQDVIRNYQKLSPILLPFGLLLSLGSSAQERTTQRHHVLPCCFLFATMFAFGKLHGSSREPSKRKGSSKVPAPGTSAVEMRLVIHLFCFLEFFLEAIVTFEEHIDKRMFILTAVYLIFRSRDFFCWHLFICHQTPT